MKHKIRQRVLDPVTGLKVTKVETVNGELGSGIFDKNGREIFEGDRVNDLRFGCYGEISFKYGALRFPNGHPLSTYGDENLEIIGHVND